MNKFIYFTLLICCITLLSCNGNAQSNIKISQKNNNSLVVFRLSKDNKNRLIRIQFPRELHVSNNSLVDKHFVKIDYSYNKNMPMERDIGIDLFQKINDEELRSISTRGKKTIKGKNSLNYIFLTRHFVDSTESIQQQLEPYVKKMIAKDQDTLHMGTIKEFKHNHKELFEKLTKNDSISIQFLDGKKIGDRLTVPVKW